MANGTRLLHPDLHYAQDAYDCAAGADFLVLATEWNEFRALDLARLAGLLQVPNDDRPAQRLRPEEMKAAGWNYVGVGRG